MNKQDKIFTLSITISLMLLSCILVENVRSILSNKQIAPQLKQQQVAGVKQQPIIQEIDVSKVKEQLKNAGLKPHDAKNWKTID